MKAYIRVDATKELPDIRGKYFTDYETTTLIFGNGGWKYKEEERHNYIDSPTPDWWLKEIDLSELMIEFADYANLNREPYYISIENFLTQKGIVIKD